MELMGRVCPHCRLRFCLPHGMAEVHGCGADAKVAARAKWERQLEHDRDRSRLQQQVRADPSHRSFW